MTYSINIGQSTESACYNIIGATCVDLSQILYNLEDNTDKEIDPRNIRDSILTAWSSASFKETSKSNIFYIGIDSGNPSNRDVKNKIFIGKRNYNNIDIMNDSLLNSDSDIFLYNTKLDSVSNSKTRVVILSGTNSYLYGKTYLQSQIVGTDTTSLDIVNESGDISFSNAGTASHVYLNDIGFPTIGESMGTIIGLTACDDNKVLWFNNGNLYWDDIVFNQTGYVGTTGSQLDIYGSQINLNGYPLEFTDVRGCPKEIGDIKVGSTFNSIAISEILRRIIYQYLPPLCSISILPPYSSGYVEVGTSPLIKLSYTISKRSNPTNVSSLSYMIPGYHPAITNSTYKTETGTASGIIITPIMPVSSTFKITVSDSLTQSIATASVTGIYPYFYGISSLSTMNTFGLSTLSKLIEPAGTKELYLVGDEYLYFIYDNDYPLLTNVINEFGATLSVSTYSVANLSSPTGLWASKDFKIYKWGLTQSIGPPSVNYTFEI